jgi:hypothetical protein
MLSRTLAAWLYTHSRTRRMWLMLQLLWGGSLLAVLTAPAASAQGIGGALSWTGLHDSYGMPIGSYFMSVVPLAEAVREQGPDFGVSPDTWGPALVSKVGTALTYTQLASWLGLECALLLCVCGLGIWFVKFALSTTWLGWLAALARPVLANIGAVVDRLHVMPGAMMICAVVGGVVALTRGVGRGVGIIFSGLLVVMLSAVLLHDPVGEMTSDNGILGIGRTLGFSLSQGVAHNGPLAAGGSGAQLDTLTGWLCDVLVRQPIQLINFGRVVDDIPGCAQLWNTALGSGDPAGPAHAMRGCAPSALAYAQQVDVSTVGLFAFLIFAIVVVLAAVDYVGCEVLRVGFKAFWNVLVIVPAAAIAVAPGPPREFAKRTALKLVIHGVEMIAATAGLGILVILMAQLTRGPLPGTVGMTNPMAKVMVMLLVGVFGAIGFRFLLHAFGDRGLPGPARVTRSVLTSTVRLGSTIGSVDYAGRRIGDMRSRLGGNGARSRSYWAAVAGRPQPPGRSAHPPTQGQRPPSTPSGGSPRRPGASGPGRGTGGGGQPAVAASSRAPGRAGGAARAAAPEVAAGAVAVGVAQHAASRVHSRGHQQQNSAPGRTPSRSPETRAAGRSASGDGTAPTGPPAPPRSAPPAGPSAPPPGRGGPTPGQQQ